MKYRITNNHTKRKEFYEGKKMEEKRNITTYLNNLELIKPCSRCDSKGRLVSMNIGFYVYCYSCGLATALNGNKLDAIDDWNTRADSQPAEDKNLLEQFNAEATYQSLLRDELAAARAEVERLKAELESYQPDICDVEGCEDEPSCQGIAWEDTGYWLTCCEHTQDWREGEQQPAMKLSAIERENSRDHRGFLPDAQKALEQPEKGEKEK